MIGPAMLKNRWVPSDSSSPANSICPSAVAGAGRQATYSDYLDHGLTVAEIRRRVGKSAAGAARVLKPESERQPVLRQLAMTIADVYLPDHPQGAAERVRAWSAVIRHAITPAGTAR